MSSIAINGFTLTHASLHATQGTGISPIERLVLGTLAGFCNFLSECWPSNQTLADRTGLHERTVRRQLESLQAKGLIERHSRGQGRAMLTRVLINPNAKTPDIVPPTPDIVPPYEPTRNILQTPNTAHEPQHQHASIAVSPPLLFSDIEQPNSRTTSAINCTATPPIPEIESLPDYSAQLQAFTNSQYAPTEATETSYSAPNEVYPAIPTLDTNQATQDPVIESDPVEAEWAKVDPQVLLDLMEIRKFKKKAPKPTKTEIKHWYSIALESGFTLAQIAYVMVLRGWGAGIANASWLAHVPRPQMTATGAPVAPAAPKVWQPDQNHIPASKDLVVKMKEEIAKMKAKWASEDLAKRSPGRQQP